jgi:hypothetical protein
VPYDWAEVMVIDKQTTAQQHRLIFALFIKCSCFEQGLFFVFGVRTGRFIPFFN